MTEELQEQGVLQLRLRWHEHGHEHEHKNESGIECHMKHMGADRELNRAYVVLGRK